VCIVWRNEKDELDPRGKERMSLSGSRRFRGRSSVFATRIEFLQKPIKWGDTEVLEIWTVKGGA